MSRYELIPFSSPDELARQVAQDWLTEVAAAQRANKLHHVALSGGRITLKFFAAVIEQVRAQSLALDRVHFFWADERCVPPDDKESSYGVAHEAFFRSLNLPAANVHRIAGEMSPERAAELASTEICRVAPANPDGQPVLDIIFLGLGEDGHVASLFPGEAEAARQNPAVYRAIANSPKPPPNRVTLGYAAIAAAKHVWVLASGAGKEIALQDSLSPGRKTPLGRVIESRSGTKVFTDIATSTAK
jgi:6-phosphogluconolactonase